MSRSHGERGRARGCRSFVTRARPCVGERDARRKPCLDALRHLRCFLSADRDSQVTQLVQCSRSRRWWRRIVVIQVDAFRSLLLHMSLAGVFGHLDLIQLRRRRRSSWPDYSAKWTWPAWSHHSSWRTRTSRATWPWSSGTPWPHTPWTNTTRPHAPWSRSAWSHAWSHTRPHARRSCSRRASSHSDHPSWPRSSSASHWRPWRCTSHRGSWRCTSHCWSYRGPRSGRHAWSRQRGPYWRSHAWGRSSKASLWTHHSRIGCKEGCGTGEPDTKP